MGLNRLAPRILADLLVSMIEGNAVSPVAREWLVKGALAYVRGEADSLDAALGLSSSGRRHLRTVALHSARDRLLLDALDCIALDEAVSTWERCQRLAAEVRKLIPLWDRHYANQASAAADWPTWKKSLFMAWRTGIDVPRTANGLQAATKRTPHYSFCYSSMTMLEPYI